MKCKHLRLIMELIFIFILPLLFLSFQVSIDKDYTLYDGTDNVSFSSQSLHYNALAYGTKTITNTTTSFEHYTTWNFDSYTGDIYMAYADFIYNVEQGGEMLAWNGSEKENVSIYIYDSTTINFNDEAYGHYYYETYTNVDIDGIDYLKVSVSNFTYDIPDEEWEFNRGYYLYTETTETTTQYSPIVKLRELMADTLLINNENNSGNTAFKFLFDYTCLWLIMFLVWHFVYRLFDWIVHLIDKKGD